jgi:iron complex outermembrane recepter protein
MLTSRLMSGAAAIAVLATFAPVMAQSTGTQEVEKVVVTGTRAATGGLIVKEKATKTRSTIDDKYTASQQAGQSVAQNLNLLPGVNFTNSDPYGSSGGNIRLRGFDGPRISLTQDGIPLNDTGNYAIFTNQLIDGEYLSRATVNTGTTDVDSPTASATGGTINTITRKPFEEMTLSAGLAYGSHDYRRGIFVFDTGEYRGVSAFAGLSLQEYDKFKGPGELQKTQANGRIYQKIGEDSFVSLIGHYNENRNNFYRNLTNAQIAFYGRSFDNMPSCTRDAPTAGVIDNENNSAAGAGVFQTATDNPANSSSCTNFYNLRINPSNTGNLRMQGNFALTDNLRLTIDPSWQYVKANGGGTATIAENDSRLRGTSGLLAVDVNGDGDTIDTAVRFYTPNNTNTSRFGVTTSLIYQLDENNKLRVAYTGDFGRHRQTGAWGRMHTDGSPIDIFGGLDEVGARLGTADGSFIRGRDRLSKAILNQAAVSYSGSFFEDTLRIDVGVRAPFFKRELNNFCFTQMGGSNVRCTTEAFTDVDADGIGTLAFTAGEWSRPYETTFKYDALLPNVGISYEFIENNIVYFSYAEGLSAPRTDNLYTVTGSEASNTRAFLGVEPERTKSFDLGFRHQGSWLTASVAIWKNTFENRIVTSFDQVLGVNVDRNVGTVELQGVDVEMGARLFEGFTAYASASYNDSELQEDLDVGASGGFANLLPTKGKALVETPEWTYAGRVSYTIENFTFGLQGKYVGERFATDVNDEIAASYTVFDANVGVDMTSWGLADTLIQINGTNLFNEEYLGNISTQTNALLIPDVNVGPAVVPRNGSAPSYSIGAPQTFQVQVRTKF